MAAGVTFRGVCGHWERCLHCSLAFILKSLDDNDMSIHFAKHHSMTHIHGHKKYILIFKYQREKTDYIQKNGN